MGKVFSQMIRPFRNYNVESRAHKVISQNKPVPAPHHKVEAMEIEQILKEKSAEFQETLRKHDELNRNLKKVFVTSKSQTDESAKPTRPLPSDRRTYSDQSPYSDSVSGVFEPKHVPKGKVSLINALQFITDHFADARKCSSDYIVKEYSLPEATVKNILKYCRNFEVYIPEHVQTKAKFAGPAVLRMRVTTKPLKQLAAGKEEKKEDMKKIDKKK